MQISGRLVIAKCNCQGTILNIICAYAPQAGSSDNIKDSFYKKLKETIESIPTHEVIIVVGDFNARLHHIYDNELENFGKHILGRGEQYLETMNQQTKDNRQKFTEFVIE